VLGAGSARTFDNDFCFQRGLEVDVPTGMFEGKVTLPDTSDGVPALAAHNGLLFISWKGSGNENLNVEFSSDDGSSFRKKHTSPETSDVPPALAAHNGILFIAWKGSGNNNMNVAQVSLVGNSRGDISIEGIVNKVVVSTNTDASPALTSHAGLLFLAWKDSSNGKITIEYSIDNGASFINTFISGETTDTPPALVSHDGALFVAWRGSGSAANTRPTAPRHAARPWRRG
jgi:hypothetical protein